jgi:hypothetical protein
MRNRTHSLGFGELAVAHHQARQLRNDRVVALLQLADEGQLLALGRQIDIHVLGRQAGRRGTCCTRRQAVLVAVKERIKRRRAPGQEPKLADGLALRGRQRGIARCCSSSSGFRLCCL